MMGHAARAVPLADTIDAMLPQTQCTRCGYAACRPYAEAIAAAGAPINRCPPGGTDLIQRLATLLDRPAVDLDPHCGEATPPRVAHIDETLCIGCTLCIAACPVDAIIGGPKKMHVVIGEWCTGCDLCIAPCPVDCIVMEPSGDAAWTGGHVRQARERYERSQARRTATRGGATANAAPAPASRPTDGTGDDVRREILAAALARARSKRRVSVNPWRR